MRKNAQRFFILNLIGFDNVMVHICQSQIKPDFLNLSQFNINYENQSISSVLSFYCFSASLKAEKVLSLESEVRVQI